MWGKNNNKLLTRVSVSFERAEPNITILGLFASIGYPLFYFVWAYLLPQPYENLRFRLINAVISIPLIFYKSLTGKLKKFFPIYFLIAALFLLPFFFGFMFFKNQMNIEWFISNLICLFFLIILFDDWGLIFLLITAGYLLSCTTVWLIDGTILFTFFQWMYVPTTLFLLAGGIVMNHRKKMANETKISLLHSLGGSIAHEMRNPLNSIINAMGSIQSILPEKPHTYKDETQYALSRSGLISLHTVLDENTETILRANKIIDSILAGMQDKELDPGSFKRTSARLCIHSAIDSFGFKTLEDRKLILEMTTTDFDFFGDKDLFIYVLFNLIKNALYYKAKPGFSIEISTHRENTWNIVRVYDTGPGIPARNIERIFDSFYTAGKKGGIGLGLSFCQQVVKSFGGEISCRSKEHEWTEFTIKLPSYNSRKSERLKREVLQMKSVLVVDDSPANRLIAGKYLADWNCTIVQAGNGAQALSKLSEKKIDLILMDIEMPVMKGDEATKRIRTGKVSGKTSAIDCRDIPIIGVSALPLNEIRQKSIESGMNDFISKPLTREDVHKIFESYFFSTDSPPIPSPNISLDGTKILVVDDNFTSRKYVSAILERLGAGIAMAENGEEAINCLDQEDYDIMLLDMEMPVLNGIDTARKVRDGSCFKRFNNFRDMPIIAMTGNTDDMDIVLTRQSGMNAHLGKPVSRNDLLKTISFWLDVSSNGT